jgi:hypothetical protein
MQGNVVEGGILSGGGAAYTLFATIEILDTTVLANEARASSIAVDELITYGGGFFFARGSKVKMGSSTLDGNLANGGSSSVAIGGAMVLGQAGTLDMVNVSFSRNMVLGMRSEGGALNIQQGKPHAIVAMEGAVFDSNTASGTLSSAGGALSVMAGTLIGNDVVFSHNLVVGRAPAGGAVVVYEDSNVDFQSATLFENNTVQGIDPVGGALWSRSVRLRATGVVFMANVVRVLGGKGKGGALHVEGEAWFENASFLQNAVRMESTLSAMDATGCVLVLLSAVPIRLSGNSVAFGRSFLFLQGCHLCWQRGVDDCGRQQLQLEQCRWNWCARVRRPEFGSGKG